MRRKAFLPIALAALLLAGLVAGSIPAIGEPSEVGVKLIDGAEETVQIDLPPGTPLENVEVPKVPKLPVNLPQCADGIDNDGDGRVDFPLDEECESPTGNAEDGSDPGTPDLPVGDDGKKQKTGDGDEEEAEEEADQGDGDEDSARRRGPRRKQKRPAGRRDDGVPTNANPALSIATFGPARIGVPNFMIDRFRIPPFLLPIYQAAGVEYGVAWEILAAINEIETDYGRNLNVSSAGAVGWMQFMPATWKAYGTDANGDKRKDPYNPVDAIFSAARYLDAAGAPAEFRVSALAAKDFDESNGDYRAMRRAIFAYNHADWYVDSVLLRAKLVAGIPPDLVGSLSGLTQGRFPVAPSARYADDLTEREVLKRAKKGNVANPINSSATRRGIDIFAKPGSPVVAVNDGVVKEIGVSERLGRFLVLQDVYGNRYTYAQLGRVNKVYPVPKERKLTAEDFRLIKPRKRARTPSLPASGKASRAELRKAAIESAERALAPAPKRGRSKPSIESSEDARERLYAHPSRPNNVDRADLAGQVGDALSESVPGYTTFSAVFSKVFKFDRKTMVMKPLREGSRVVAGTVLGKIGERQAGKASHVHFSIRPVGKGAPKIDPKPILDGWKLLESTAIYRAAGKNPFFGPDAKRPSIGQIMLMSQESLERRVLADPRVEIYSCGRGDVQTGQINRRVLATLAYLAESGFKPTVTSLKCGHGYYTKSGNVSHHSSGNAVDIARVNGLPILGNQGPGSITEAAVKELCKLQGTMRPAQVITLHSGICDPTFAMADHADHIHVGFRPLFGPNGKLGEQVARILKPDQWERLISRISEIENPTVRIRPSKYSLPVKGKKSSSRKRASDAHVGE